MAATLCGSPLYMVSLLQSLTTLSTLFSHSLTLSLSLSLSKGSRDTNGSSLRQQSRPMEHWYYTLPVSVGHCPFPSKNARNSGPSVIVYLPRRHLYCTSCLVLVVSAHLNFCTFQAPNPHALRRKYEREKLIPR